MEQPESMSHWVKRETFDESGSLWLVLLGCAEWAFAIGTQDCAIDAKLTLGVDRDEEMVNVVFACSLGLDLVGLDGSLRADFGGWEELVVEATWADDFLY